MNYDKRATCLHVVLLKGITWNEAFTKRIVKHICEEGLISEDEKKEIGELDEENKIWKLSKRVSDFIIEDWATRQTLKDLLNDSKVDSAVISLISSIVESGLPKYLVVLIEKWGTLVKLENVLKEDIVDYDPSYGNFDNPWPLKFIYFCAQNENHKFLENLCETGKTFQGICSSTHGFEIPCVAQPDDEVLDTGSDYGPESFDMISEDDFAKQEDCYTTTAPGNLEPNKLFESSHLNEMFGLNGEENDIGQEQQLTEAQVESIGDILKDIVAFLYPNDPELIKAEKWPHSLFATITENKETQICFQFMKAVTCLLEYKKECGSVDFPSLPRLEVDSAKVWIFERLHDFSQFKKGFSVLRILYKMAWPGVELNRTELLKKYDLEQTRTHHFVNIAQVFLCYSMDIDESDKVRRFSHENAQSDESETDSSVVTSESDSDSDDSIILEDLIQSVGDHLPLFVKLSWPDDVTLVEENWCTNLEATLADEDDPELCKKFIKICVIISKLKEECTGIEAMPLLSCESAKDWISSDFKELLLSTERKVAIKLVFDLTWKDLKLSEIETGQIILEEQFQKNEGRATDFVNAAQILLKLFKVSASMSQNCEEISEKVSDAEQEISFFECKHNEISQSRHVLLPFVKLFWPDHASILDEEKWPGELIAIATASSQLGQTFIDICKDILELKKDIKYAAWPKSADAKASRDWILTISDRIELLSEWSDDIDKLFRVSWPELERVLLQKLKYEDHRVIELVNAFQMFFELIKTHALKTVTPDSDGKDTSFSSHDPGIKENSEATFLRDYYDDIDFAKDLLLPVIDLMYPTKSEIPEDVHWPIEFIATVLEDNEPNREIIISTLKHILDMKKAVPDHCTEETKLDNTNVYNWFVKNVKNLNKFDEESPIFCKLYQLAWPNRNEGKIKSKQIKIFWEEDLGRTLVFARAVEIILLLKQEQKKTTSRTPKSKKSSKKREKCGEPADQKGIQTRERAKILEKATKRSPCVTTESQEKLKNTTDKDQHISDVATESQDQTLEKATKRSSRVTTQSQEKVKNTERDETEFQNTPAQPPNRQNSDVAKSHPEYQQTQSLGDTTESHGSGKAVEHHNFSPVQTRSQKHTQDNATYGLYASEVQEKIFHLQVSVPHSITNVHVKIGNINIELEKIRDNIYAKTLYWQQNLQYKYYGQINGKYEWEKVRDSRTLLNPGYYVLDLAVWNGSNVSSWDDLMKDHLPPNYVSVDLMHYWLKQMKDGWKFCDGSTRLMPTKKFQHHICLWLQSWNKSDVIFGALTTLIAMKNLRYVIDNELLRNLLIWMQIDFFKVDRHQLYHKILSQSTSQISEFVLEVLNQQRDNEPTFLLTLPLYLLLKNDPERGMITLPVFGKLAVLSCVEGERQLLEDLGLDVKWTNAKYLEKTFQKNLVKLHSYILSTCNATSWIVAPYQRLLTLDSVMKLLDKDIVNFFRLDWILEDVFEYAKEGKGMVEMLQRLVMHFGRMFQNAEGVAREFSDDDAENSMKMMINLSTILVKALKTAKMYRNQAFIAFCVDLAYLIAKWSCTLTKQSSKLTNDEVIENTRRLLDYVPFDLHIKFKKADLEVCDRMLKNEFDSILQYDWTVHVQNCITALIHKTWSVEDDEKYLKYYTDIILPLDLSENLMHCFIEKAIHCAQTLISDDEMGNIAVMQFFCIPLPSNNSTKKMAVFEKLFLEEFKKYESFQGPRATQQTLKFVSGWSIATRFFEVFSKPSALEYLPKARDKILKIKDICLKFVESLNNETTLVENIKSIGNSKNRKNLCGFLECIQAGKASQRTDHIENIICSFEDRINRFHSEREEVLSFFDLCKSIEDIGVHIECEKIKHLYSSSVKTIREVVTVEDLRAHPEQYDGLSKQHFDEFRLMKKVKKSNSVLTVWKTVAKECRDKKNMHDENVLVLPWKEALTLIWENVKMKICSLANSVEDGSVAINVVVKMFEPVARCYDDLLLEMGKIFCFYGAVISKDENVIPLDDIARQVYCVFELLKNSMGLRWVLKFKEVQQLDCDFESLTSIFNAEENTEMTLNDINRNTLENFPCELREMTHWQLTLLQHFLKEKDLIVWLKTTKMTDVSEVKGMCDLILASAGETPFETDKVMHLLSATECFAPLLFHLDEINSLKDLLMRCRKVWTSVEHDGKILQKWADSGSQVKWLREQESLYDSDQKKSLVLAQEINERGVYTVGRLTEEHPTLKNSVLLTFRSNSPEANRHKGFNLDDLQDLQSKLALLAGEGDQTQQDIAQFVDLFSMVKNLAESFINLTEAGCMLFSDWNAIITSSPYMTTDRQNEFNLTLTLQFMKSDKSTLAGTASLSVLQELSKTLRLTNDQWTKYISSKRLQHYYLNEYSMQQITYLCQELAKTENIASLPDQVLALLSNTSKNLVARELQDALDEATKFDFMTGYGADENENMQEIEPSLTELEKKKRAIRKLVNNDDIAENLAKAAVQAVGYECIEDCLTWAMLNEFEEEKVKENLTRYNEDNAFALHSSEEEEMTSILQNRSIFSLTEMIAQILKTSQAQETIKIVGAVKTICSRYFEKTSTLTMRDYLSVDHLGKFLSILARDGKLTTVVERDIGGTLHCGKPNMIICSEVDMLTLLLSLYMTNSHQPLPTASEVLLCSEQTSVDEVERFMHRAMCKSATNGKPLFCMVFTDKLKFNISKALENIYDKLQQQQQHLNEQYQLIFMTSNTHHYISECFDKYHVQERPDHKNKTDILKYLLQHLSSDETLTGRDTSSVVQIVVSNRSGVGKSLYVKKLCNQIDRRWYEEAEQTPLMKLFITVLNRPVMPTVNRILPESLKTGQVNFVYCQQNDSLDILLGLYMNNAKQPPPTLWEVLVCCQQTTEEEVEQFFRRSMCKMQFEGKHVLKCIFTLAFGEWLKPIIAQRIKGIYEELSGNMHCQKDFFLVIISSGIQYFEWCEKFIPVTKSFPTDRQNFFAYLHGEDVPEGNKLVLEKIDHTVKNNENTGLPTDFMQPSIWRKTTIRLLEKRVDTDHALERLYREDHFRNEDNHFIHIDLTPTVEDGIECFMFNLLILGSIQDSKGRIWNKQKQHIYVVEMTKSNINEHQIHENSILNILPRVTCLSPLETFEKLKVVKRKTRNVLEKHLTQTQEEVVREIAVLQKEYSLDEFCHVRSNTRLLNDRIFDLLQLSGFPLQVMFQILGSLTGQLRTSLESLYQEEGLNNLHLMDYEWFLSTTFQRPYQYLKHAAVNNIKLDDFQYCQPAGTQEDCLKVLLQHYVSTNPNWAQLKHFASFLNIQLQNCEECVFCQKIGDTELRGLKDFAVKFMIRMSQDFATPSLVIADQSGQDLSNQVTGSITGHDVIDAHQLRRTWEEKCHPYVFFNKDRSMSFINVDLNHHGDLLDADGNILVERIADKHLVQGLKAQQIKLGFNFQTKDRQEKLCVLRTIMGLPHSESDPDNTYELTTDNVLKILAIYMRLRCGIPVIVMGETGCGKTRLVEFMSKIRAGNNDETRNMVTLKIHGGVNADNIYKSVEKAISIANENAAKNMSTVLFYDEANTTRAIYAIKEVVCDNTINGVSFQDKHLQIVAACNPYKRLSDQAIATLENAGLGYRVSASQTVDCFGEIPMRRLVYKVVALPPSMQPFVWDFGQLSAEIEKKYIQQMTMHLKNDLKLSETDKEIVDFLICEAQIYMKKNTTEECRYVSLRDVERCMKVFSFFHQLADNLRDQILKNLRSQPEKDAFTHMTNTFFCLIQTIGVCYHVSLDKGRKRFREHLSESLLKKQFDMSASDLNNQLIACQEVFLNNIKLDNTIAPNEAVRENVYLITICCELQIPLFVVGKPGSSKSLSKTIVADNMRGKNSYSTLFSKMKQIYTVSYQCSALTKADGIEKVFKQCADFQKKEDIDAFSAVVILDEIGLAEDSPNMPLKVLHPLLECGSTESGTIASLEPRKKVGFVGISNWALDPAKMNRGLFVTRSTPNKEDLLATAKSIMQKEIRSMQEEQEILEKLTKAYLDIYNNSQGGEATKEYFGLRDYYSLIKMVNSKSEKKEKCDFKDVAYAAQRNFSGGHESHFDQLTAAVQQFYQEEVPEKISMSDIINDNLGEISSRFLLLLTGQHSSVSLLQHLIPDFQKTAHVIFGSSFPGDNTYTEICKNINRIKICMESGRTVVLLNLTEIHESLYEALNQHFMKYGGQRYVDIGLGSHRIKCRVSDKFRLIVLEHKDKVYREYPIPLINRLEKHHLTPQCLLSGNQEKLSQDLSVWCKTYSAEDIFSEKDAFVGYHAETPGSVVLSQGTDADLTTCKHVLLQSATADIVYRALKHSASDENYRFLETYTKNQVHDNLLNLLRSILSKQEKMVSLMTITSFSSILTEKDRKKLESCLELNTNSIMLMSLQQFDTQQEYLSRLEKFFADAESKPHSRGKILLIQCSQAQRHGSLLACAKYCVMNMLKNLRDKDSRTIIAFLLSTQRQHGFINNCPDQLLLQHTEETDIIHVDDLRPPGDMNAVVSEFYGKNLTDILKIGAEEIKKQTDKGDQFLVLLKESVCQAMAKLKRRKVNDDRYIKCIDPLTRLLDINDKICHNFCYKLSKHMSDIYLQRDSDPGHIVGDWKVKEACSAENLQEGGTFGKTLLLCLKRHLANLLAFVISCIDTNNNLEVLYDFERKGNLIPWQVTLWLKLFGQYTMEWKNMKSSKEFFVQFDSHLANTFSPSFPFSFKLNTLFDELWFTNEDGGHDQKNILKQFEARPESKAIKQFYEKFEEEMVYAFATDLIQFNFDYDETLEFLTKILLSISRKQQFELTQGEDFRNDHGIALVYYSFRLYKSHLLMLHEIFKIRPEVTENIEGWIKQQENEKEFMIHALAIKHLLEWVKKFSIEDHTSCIQWMNLTSKCKKIFLPAIHLINNLPYKEQVHQIWDPISLLDLFLLQLLPGSEEKTFENYVKVVVNHSKRLHKPLQSFGFCDETFLKILLNVLRKSFDDIELKLLVCWQDLVCRMCRRRFSNPVKLPCGHFICNGCVKNMLAAAEMRRQCPLCPTSIPQDFVSKSESLSPEAMNQLKKFKSNCTSFFLEYLEKFCFSGTNQEHICDRLQLIFNEFVIGVKNDRPKLETRAIDMNISTKSCILQCLQNTNKVHITTYINSLLQSSNDDLNEIQKQNLILVILVSCEANIHDLDSFETLKKTWENVTNDVGVDVEKLSDIAKIRFHMQKYISEILEEWRLLKENDTEFDLRPEIVSMIRMCKKDKSGILRNFATKIGCELFGMSWLNLALGDKYLEDLVPRTIKKESDDNFIDHFFLLGPYYANMRVALDRDSIEDHLQQLAECLSEKESVHKRISLITAAIHISGDLRKLLNQMSDSHKYGWIYAITNFFQQEKNYFLAKQNHAVRELVILTGSLAMCKPHLLHNFCKLATAPSECENQFWPAMPASLFFSFQNALQQESNIAMYACPNGHPYVIGECLRPWRESECPECGEVIGGRLHVAAERNQRIEISEERDMGYQLLNTDLLGKDDPSDRTSKQCVAIVHCMLHCCMLIGLENDTSTICRMLNKESKELSGQYLCKKIFENILDLAQAIGRNSDDSVIIMHLCLNNILQNGFDVEEEGIDWTTMENRERWEVQFRKLYLLPVFQDLDSNLALAHRKLNTSEKFKHSRLYRLTHEIDVEEPPKEFTWYHSALWKTIKHSNAAHLLQFVADSTTADSVLKVILDTPELECLQNLEKVLRLQKIFISKYQNTIDLKQAESITFAKYLEEMDGFKNRKLVQEYIDIWNKIILKRFFQPDNLPKEYLQKIVETSPVAMALPSSRGRGKCAKHLAERLIDMHNNFLQKCFGIIKTPDGMSEVDVVQLFGSNHLICIDKNKDLLSLIRAHTSYTITDGDESNFGPQHVITYNVDALEKQVREKFVAYKPLINKKSLPCITYSQDIGIGTDWNRVIDNIPQKPLSNKLIQEVDGLMTDQNSTPADICEGVRTLTHAISFLARIRTEESQPLQEYLKDNLLLSSNHMTMIPKSALISQTLALYQRLMWRKAVNFVQQGLNPYEEALSTADQEDIQDPSLLEVLRDAFEHMDMNLFQQRLNEILIQVPDYDPNWSLTENIFPYIEFIEENTSIWYERIPSQICFKHISHLFQLSVKGISTTT